MRTSLPSRCVYDASFLIKYVVPEDGSTLIRKLVREALADTLSVMCVPELFLIESANILWKKVQRREVDTQTSLTKLEQLSALELATTPLKQLDKRALELACQLNISAYDASYVALAEKLQVPLITADISLARKLVGTEHRAITLAEFLPPSQ